MPGEKHEARLCNSLLLNFYAIRIFNQSTFRRDHAYCSEMIRNRVFLLSVCARGSKNFDYTRKCTRSSTDWAIRAHREKRDSYEVTEKGTSKRHNRSRVARRAPQTHTSQTLRLTFFNKHASIVTPHLSLSQLRSPELFHR